MIRHVKGSFLVASFLLSGCLGTIRVNESALMSQHNANFALKDTTTYSWFWGLSEPSEINVMGFCGNNGMGGVEVQRTFGNFLASVMTFGIVNPMTVRVKCQ